METILEGQSGPLVEVDVESGPKLKLKVKI